jgi:galactokinase/mevalonate kinase-like predicted kinase
MNHDTEKLLKDISRKMDVANEKLDRLKNDAAISGAWAGALSGGVSGALVSGAIMAIKTKFGL